MAVPVARYGIAAPAARLYRAVLTPPGHGLRWIGTALLAPARRAAVEAGRAARAALASARETVRRARRDAWRALAGSPAAARSGEPRGIAARTLGSTPTVPSAAQATETPPGGEKLVERGRAGAAPRGDPKSRGRRATAPAPHRGEEPLGKRQPEGPPPAPAVQRIRLRYTKRGRLRFTSHRDFQRAFERALRRSEVPMAYSAGFTPHPKVSYANAAPTGTGSEAEFLEIALTEARDPDTLRAMLDASMPTGLDIVDAVEARTSGLAERLTASVWEMRLDGVDAEDVRPAVAAFNAAGSVEVQRKAKNGIRTFDARAAVADLRVVDAPADRPGERPCAILRLVVRHVTPAVRPDDVLSGLRAVADLAPPVPAAVTRLAQGLFDEESGTVTDPLAPDREAAPTAYPAVAGAAVATAPEGAGSA